MEAGTSFGVSTIYLALAVAENAKRVSATTKPRVIATEKEESKAELARAHWAKAGRQVEDVIELRVGDLRETLTEDLGTVDFLLLDSKLVFIFLVDAVAVMYRSHLCSRPWLSCIGLRIPG